jgi:hypothetical protein
MTGTLSPLRAHRNREPADLDRVLLPEIQLGFRFRPQYAPRCRHAGFGGGL